LQKVGPCAFLGIPHTGLFKPSADFPGIPHTGLFKPGAAQATWYTQELAIQIHQEYIIILPAFYQKIVRQI
jgi:hypothetical protein